VSASLVPLFLWPLIAAAFVALSWRPYRERRWPLIALLLAAFSLAHGYASYRMFCAQPLTCDVGSPADNLFGVSAHFAVQAALGYGAAIGFIAFSQRATDGTSLSSSAAVLGALVATGASYVGGAILSLVWQWPL
jgi:hypothetical protein